MKPENESHRINRTFRFALQTVGLVSLALGFAGAFLPLLPTTPFILLSAWCFAKSSPRWNAYIHSHSEFGPLLRNWRNQRSVSLRHKIAAALMVSVSIVTLLLSDRPVELKWGLSLGLSLIFVLLVFTKTSKPQK